MLNNLVISFEIRDWLRQGALVVGAIEELGPFARIFGTTWYVHSDLDAEAVAARIAGVMNPADGLVVIDVSSNAVAAYNVDDRTVRFMSEHWHSPGSAALSRSAAPAPGLKCIRPARSNLAEELQEDRIPHPQ